jgi:hypothetical protein
MKYYVVTSYMIQSTYIIFQISQLCRRTFSVNKNSELLLTQNIKSIRNYFIYLFNIEYGF